MTTQTVIPLPPDDLRELAQWWADHEASVAVIKKAERRLSEYVRDTGLVRVEGGVVCPRSDGFQYDCERIADVLPDAVSKVTLTVGIPGTQTATALARASRVVSLCEEEIGDDLTYIQRIDVQKDAVKAAARVRPELNEFITPKVSGIEVRRG